MNIYRKSPSIRPRPFYPWRALMVYVPSPPALHWLNSTAWLAYELIDGVRNSIEVVAMVQEIGGEAAGSEQDIADCLKDLEQKGILLKQQS